MYKIYADDTLIYDSTIEDYKIGKGSGALESNKAGSFTFSVYPEHFFYDSFVKKRTVIIVTKSDRILFRGRVLDDKVDMWKRKEIICEGELNFLQDSFIRPYTFNGTPEEAFIKFVTEHNSQVDEFKRFKIGQVTVYDPNNYIARSNSNYENALKNLTSRLLEDSLGGYLHISHGEDGKDPAPTLNYLADFTEISSQNIEFGSNLKDYLKKGIGQAIATAIIPLGVKLESANTETDPLRLTIADVNDGVDYVYDEAAVAKHGWIFDTVIYDDVTIADNLKIRGLNELSQRIRENITVTLTAVDLHLLDRSIESFRYDTYVRVISTPHNFAETLLCYRQTFDLLRPDTDSVSLGTSYDTFTTTVATAASAAAAAKDVKRDVDRLNQKTGQYKIAEQQLTSLLANSFGVFKTETVMEDGSTVCYLHDKPQLSESTNIWKMTGDAFAVSSDGGMTWSAGIDASGNAIMNALSVIGIDASWIKANNLDVISANLGGWMFDEDGIYKTATDIDLPDYTYKFTINAPNEHIMFGDDFNVIDILRSTDGGKSFSNSFKVNGYGSATSRSGIYESYMGRGLFTSSIDGYGSCSHSWAGTSIRDAGQPIYTRAYFERRDTYPDSPVDLYADGSVRSGDGVYVNFDFGGVVFEFRGGILVNIYYYL